MKIIGNEVYFFVYLATRLKTVIYKISAIILSLIVLLSTLSISVEKHYCKGNLVDSSFFGQAEDCMSKKAPDNCEKENSCQKDCCDNEVEHLKNQQDLLKHSVKKLQLNPYAFTPILFNTGINALELTEKQHTSIHYKPPEIALKIHVLHEVYLI